MIMPIKEMIMLIKGMVKRAETLSNIFIDEFSERKYCDWLAG
jgi:hypothetical protein